MQGVVCGMWIGIDVFSGHTLTCNDPFKNLFEWQLRTMLGGLVVECLVGRDLGTGRLHSLSLSTLPNTTLFSFEEIDF